MKLSINSIVLALLCNFSVAQSLGELKAKDDLYGKRNLSSKEIYVANFSVNYQIYNVSEKKTASEFTGNKLSGNTKAKLSVGLGNISAQDLQQLTDQAYTDFVNSFKEKGFSFINADVAGQTNFYKDYERVENPEMSLSEAPGLVTVYPSNNTFYVKGYTKDGKKKQGGFFSKVNSIKGNGGNNENLVRMEELKKYTSLSKDLNDANIVDVNLYVLFLNDDKAYQGSGAKIRVKTYLRISANDYYLSTTENTSALVKFGIASNKKTTGTSCVSSFDIIQGKDRISGPKSSYNGYLKKNLDINGVMSEEKITSFAQAATSMGMDTAFGKTFQAEGKSVETAALIPTNSAAYKKGVQMALQTFINYHIDNFVSNY